MVERIKQLCGLKGISIAQLERTLNFANGSIAKTNASTSVERIQAIANYFNVSMEYIYSGDESSTGGEGYYLDKETAATAQELYENKELRVLFDAARDARPEDLKMAADMLRRFKETNPDG